MQLYICTYTWIHVAKYQHVYTYYCFKLVNCLQFGLLPASIVSRIAYSMGICLPLSASMATKPKQEKQCFPNFYRNYIPKMIRYDIYIYKCPYAYIYMIHDIDICLEAKKDDAKTHVLLEY